MAGSTPQSGNDMDAQAREIEKRAAAEAAAELVCDGDRVGLGTGSTVAYLLPALAARGLTIRCAATSPATESIARELGLSMESLAELGELDIAIDGADQVAPDGWLVKGGGGAHTREKVIAAAARRFVVIASSDKLVEALRPPVPLEILVFAASRHAVGARAGRAARLPAQPRRQPDRRLPGTRRRSGRGRIVALGHSGRRGARALPARARQRRAGRGRRGRPPDPTHQLTRPAPLRAVPRPPPASPPGS